MGNTRDPIDHFRTTNQYAGEQFIDVYSWPGVVSIVLGTTSLISCVAAAAYGRHEWIPTAGIVGLLAITGGIVWLGSRPVEWCKSGRVSACGSVVATMP